MVSGNKANAELPRRGIFRQQALQQYLQGREKTILPRYTGPSVFALLWGLLGVLTVAAWAVWSSRVPIYSMSACAVINTEGQAVIFLRPEHLPKLRVGQKVQILLNERNHQLLDRVASVEPTLIGPTEARARYQLDGASLSALKRPSSVAVVELGEGFDRQTYAGSVVRARVEIGSIRVASMLPVVGQLIGEEQWN